MAVPLRQQLKIASYIVAKKLRGERRYPLVLMLEPLFQCNLACAGCGKIDYEDSILRRRLSVEECLAAVDECGAPVVSIPGGEPLVHADIAAIVAGIVARKKFVYLCTNGLRLAEKLGSFTPSRYFSFSVHLDGQRRQHDAAVCRAGVYDTAVAGIQAALRRGFRVTTNTTLYAGAEPESVRAFFDEMMDLGVEGMMVSPGYPYPKAPDQAHFLDRAGTRRLFGAILDDRKPRWRFNLSPLFLEFLAGAREFPCTPWGMPTYNIFGWQKPCYLLQDGYAESFAELLAETAWDRYGVESGNPQCANCMVHSGYEASAVDATFGSVRGLLTTARAVLFPAAVGRTERPERRPASTPAPGYPLWQIEGGPMSSEERRP